MNLLANLRRRWALHRLYRDFARDLSRQSQKCKRCSHIRATHEHFRHGSDCGACGPADCWEFKR